MLLHAAHIPHSPLLIPEVHQAEEAQLAQTHEALQELSEHIYTLRPDTLVIIAGQETHYPKAFSIELAPEFIGDLRPFGDLSKPGTYQPATRLADALQRHGRRNEYPITLTTNDTLDYSAAVALRLLTEDLPDIKVLPVNYSGLSQKEHLRFGGMLREVIERQNNRVVVVSVGDLSHCLNADSPAGYCVEGTQFDTLVRDALSQRSVSALMNIDETIIEKAHEGGYRPLLILMGLLDKTNYRSEILAYESPFGVGYLTAQFHVR